MPVWYVPDIPTVTGMELIRLNFSNPAVHSNSELELFGYIGRACHSVKFKYSRIGYKVHDLAKKKLYG